MIPSLEQLHHATVVTGNREKNLAAVKDFLVASEIAIVGNPDLLIFDDEQLLMDDAEKIIRAMATKSFGAKRFCLISTDRIAADVQNTLLKTLEEPQEGVHFFLILPSADRLLPTVMSRVQVIAGDTTAETSRLDVAAFLKKKPADRFAYIETWTKAKKDEDNVSKSEVLHFIDHLEQHLWNESGSRDEQLFADIRKMREYANIRGASHRVILDFLAMVVPVGGGAVSK